jgi:HK97 family phage prohead protease
MFGGDSSRPSVAMEAAKPTASFSVDVPPEMLEAMTAGGMLDRRISRNEALQVPAVMRARNLIAGTLSTLPHVVIDPQRREVPTTYLLGGNIDPDIPNSVLLAQTYEDLLFEGIAWWRVTARGWHGFPVEARHVPVESVHVAGIGTLPSQSQISPDQLFPVDGQVFIDGIPVRDDEVIRFDSPNPPLLRHAARAIRTALKLDRIAALYADNPVPLGALEPREGAEPLSAEPGSAGDGSERSEVDALLDDWEIARSKRAWAYLQAVTAKTLQWNPEQLQLADQRQHAVLEIARASGIDPEDLGVSTTSRTYANQEQRWQALINLTFASWVAAVRDRLSMRDVLPRGYRAKVRFDDFQRADTPTRMTTYKTALEVGAYAPDEIRAREDLPELTPAQKAASRPAPQPTEPAAEPDPAREMEADVSAASFSADQNTTLSFDDPEAYATFRVNEDKRTISGMVVPWGKVAVSRGARWRFSENSLRWGDASRIKLNLRHDRHQSVGYAAGIRNTSKGLDITFKVAEIPEGDRALALAAGKAWDGLSVEIDFEDEFGDDWHTDPSDRNTRLVRQAKLKHVALTPTPAFDDARVAAVAASTDQSEVDDGPQGQGERRQGRGRRVRVRSRRVH